MLAVNFVGTAFAVFGPIGFGNKRHLAYSAPLNIGAVEDFGFQRGIAGKNEPPEPFAVDRVGDALHADRFFAIVQQEAVSAVVVATLPPDECVRPFALTRCHPGQRTIRPTLDGRQVFDAISDCLSLFSLIFGRP